MSGAVVLPAPRLIILRPICASAFGAKYCHGCAQSTLLRPYRDNGYLERTLPSRAGGSLCPAGTEDSDREQGGSQSDDQRLPEVGGSPCPQPDPVECAEKGVRRNSRLQSIESNAAITFPGLLETCLPQTIQEVFLLSVQRSLFQQPARLRSEERNRSSRRGPEQVPNHHRPFGRIQAQSLNVHVDFPCCRRLLCLSPSVRSAIPASKSRTPNHPASQGPVA